MPNIGDVTSCTIQANGYRAVIRIFGFHVRAVRNRFLRARLVGDGVGVGRWVSPLWGLGLGSWAATA
jgi:hypothetical protein